MTQMELFEMNWTTTTTEPDEPADVRELAESLMAQHGLDSWTLVFDQSKTRAGVCRRRERVIGLSTPLMTLWTTEQRRDTILHEIAHALTTGGHGPEWQRMCIRIGADPTRTWGHNGEQEIPPKFVGTCPAGHTLARHRRPRKPVSCGECSNRYDTRYLITWTTVR